MCLLTAPIDRAAPPRAHFLSRGQDQARLPQGPQERRQLALHLSPFGYKGVRVYEGAVRSRVRLCEGEPCLVASCCVLSCLVVSCLVLSCLVVSCLVVSCRVLFCLVVSCLALLISHSSLPAPPPPPPTPPTASPPQSQSITTDTAS